MEAEDGIEERLLLTLLLLLAGSGAGLGVRVFACVTLTTGEPVALVFAWKAKAEPNSRFGAEDAPTESRWMPLPPGDWAARATGAGSSRTLERLE
jgi:hypothetical protein